MSIVEGDFSWEAYRYIPSLPGLVVASVTFAVLGGIHIYLVCGTRLKYMIPISIGAVFEVAGYIARGFSHQDKSAWGPFIVQGCFILIAPLFFAASIYMMLGRTISGFGLEDFSIIPVRILTTIFVTGDVLAFIIQVAGSIVMAFSFDDFANAERGNNVVIAGLAVQVAFFVMFVITSATFHYQVRASHSKAESRIGFDLDQAALKSLERILFALYSMSVLILLRCTFRLAEYTEGNSGYIISREIFLYMLDTVLMMLVLVLLLVLRPEKAIQLALEMRIPIDSIALVGLPNERENPGAAMKLPGVSSKVSSR